jgi:hypothetical protein
MILTPKRIYEEELLDAGAGTDDDVARNLTDGELRAMAERAGMRRFKARRVFPYRLLLVAESRH